MSEIKDDGGVSGGHESSDTSDEEEMIDAEVEQEDAEIEQEDAEVEQEESAHSEEEEDQSPAENGESPLEANLSDNQEEAVSPEHTTEIVMDENINGDVDEQEKSKSEGSPANHFEVAAAPSDGISETKIEDRSGEELNNEVNDAAEPQTQKENGVKEEEVLKEEVALVQYPVNTEGSNQSFAAEQHIAEGDESGSEEEQAAFMKELETFFREKSLEFKPPKFYGEGLNCLKLWRAVTRLGGYDQVTSCKLWRQVGESFKPPKTCTTVSWSFRCFYEKALLEYERHKMRGGELCIPVPPIPEPIGVEQVDGHKASGSGRARRDAAARAMQGWHSQRLLGNGEVGDPIIKDKNSIATPKRDKHLKSVGVLKRKKPSSLDRAVKAERTVTKAAKPQLNPRPLFWFPSNFFNLRPVVAIVDLHYIVDTVVADIGPAADWVKINVRRTKDCFEVYALVPGLLREEVRVQSDPAGRLVISGDPEQPDNPWGVTPFKKVISLPSRIDPHQTSAVVTLHGQLFVRVPFEQSDL